MNTVAFVKGAQPARTCTVCGRHSKVWCHIDESRCSECDQRIHSVGPLASTQERTSVSTGVVVEDRMISGGWEGHANIRSRIQQLQYGGADTCPRQEAFFDVGGQWVQELGPTEEQASTAVQSYDWNSPDLGNYLVNGSFEVNVLDVDLDFLMGAVPDFNLPDVIPPPCAPISKAAATGTPVPPTGHAGINAAATVTTRSSNLETSSSTSEKQPTPVPCAPATTPAAIATSSSSGPLLVPTDSYQSIDQQTRPTPEAIQPARPDSDMSNASDTPPAADTTLTPPPAKPPSAAPHASSAAVVAPVQMMPFVPQPMVVPGMHTPVQCGGWFMPMWQPGAWDTYMPASLLAQANAEGHSAMLQERRAKRVRFQEKKRRMSCRRTVRYASRKRYADSRPRINGRFISKSATAAAAAAMTAVVMSDESV